MRKQSIIANANSKELACHLAPKGSLQAYLVGECGCLREKCSLLTLCVKIKVCVKKGKDKCEAIVKSIVKVQVVI